MRLLHRFDAGATWREAVALSALAEVDASRWSERLCSASVAVNGRGRGGESVRLRDFVMANRKLPRKFSMPWGDGQVVDEVGVETEHNEIVIQLLRYDELPGATLRFCQYWLDGKFQRQPMMLAEADIDRMRAALGGAPEIHGLLKRLVADD